MSAGINKHADADQCTTDSRTNYIFFPHTEYSSTKVNYLGSRAAVGYFGKEYIQYAFAIRPNPMSQGLIAAFSIV